MARQTRMIEFIAFAFNRSYTFEDFLWMFGIGFALFLYHYFYRSRGGQWLNLESSLSTHWKLSEQLLRLRLESSFGISRKGTDDGGQENRYGFPCDWMCRVRHTNNFLPWDTCFAWSVDRLCHLPRLEQIWMARPWRSLFFSLWAFPLGIYQEKQMTEQHLLLPPVLLLISAQVIFWILKGFKEQRWTMIELT